MKLIDEDGQLIKLASGRNAVYPLPVGCTINVDQSQKINAGDVIAKIPRETSKTKDITGGLPRVAELFEARSLRVASLWLSLMEPFHSVKIQKGKRKVLITSDDGNKQETYLIAKGRHLLFGEGDYVRKGDDLVDGSPNPHEILEVLGEIALAELPYTKFKTFTVFKV